MPLGIVFEDNDEGKIIAIEVDKAGVAHRAGVRKGDILRATSCMVTTGLTGMYWDTTVARKHDYWKDFDLPKNIVSEIAISCMESINVGFILFPESISLFDISNGKEKLLHSINIPKSSVDQPDSKRVYKLSLKQEKIDRVRLKIKSNRKLPKGHVAEGRPG